MLTKIFLDLFAADLVDAGVYLTLHPGRNKVLAEAASTFPLESFTRLEMLAGTQGSEALGVVFARIAERASDAGDDEILDWLRFHIGGRPDSVVHAALWTSESGLVVLVRALRFSRVELLEPLARGIITRAEIETDTVKSDSLIELVTDLLEVRSDLYKVLVDSRISRAA